ncbi:54S ribosomal protein, mitochondrial [Lachnellula hyalina]|uniref:54S ribosomal protein, mitochondrial n=1 Tax=Lachnellula hyalina TaxID=1316788 RepID=A0A8H8R8J4_9HELO|nr:54S ribosomal protein, mitochondrial [Lachnellula hyalina]TVY30574.1 54S ribosomal protein, mitochondrial [Lachnellula hyalina]
MQKVIKRTVLAERQAARRLKRRTEKNTRDNNRSAREQRNYVRGDETNHLKQARLNRREDYELGPLAPRRDVGDWTDKWGTISSMRARGQDLHPRDREKIWEPWGGKFLNIVVGDRVVIIEGRDKGKIGVIKDVSRERGEVTVGGLNLIDVTIPEYMIGPDEQDKRPIRTMEKPVSVKSIRLVVPLTDADSGVTRDVIVKKVIAAGMWFDKHAGKASWSRVIPGLDINIPWPKKESVEYKDEPNDTLRIDVETKTFVPTLLTPPMPGTVIDELRNKFSVFRTRHDPEYIAAKEEEDRLKEEKKRTSKQMRTPLKEANRLERKAKKALGKGKLTEEMLEKIGKLVAEKRQLALEAAGVSKEGAASEEPVTATA